MNIKKCQFRQTELVYLGHKLTSEGIWAHDPKIKAVVDMPKPIDKKGIQRLIGMLNYLSKFLPNMSEIVEPLRNLMKKNTDWCWEKIHDESFQKIKDMLTSKQCLAYYDVTKDVVIQVDACKTGLGAILLQEGRPVAYASKALTPTQLKYAIIEKEMMAVLFGCEKFHQYVDGKKILVESDHRPLESITKKPLANAPPRLQRMLLQLQKYDVNVRYKEGRLMIFADTLSRAHLSETSDEIPEDEVIAQVHMVETN